jgi:cytochrome P450
VAAFLAAANCDPAKFEDEPHQFDIGRHPNPHLFGTGVHFCLGFQLARAEAAIGFERVFARFPDMRLPVEPLTSSGAGGPESAR